MKMQSCSSLPCSSHGVDWVPTAGTCAAEPECASGAASRTLIARVGFTHAKRGAGPLDQSHIGDGRLLSFGFKVFGFPTGLREGVLLGPADPSPLPGLQEFAGDVGAGLLKITRSASSPAVPGELRVQRQRLWTVVQRSFQVREMLPLGPGYEETLASFGRHTRRNVRHVRKLASASGLRFETATGPALISANDQAGLARQTEPKGVPLSLSYRLEAYANRTGRPFRTVVYAPNGEIVSYGCGYFGDASSAYLLYQLNNPAFHALSPSLLNRAYLIEWLVGQGCRELLFVFGCSGVLHNACVPQPLEEVLLMRRTPLGYLAASPMVFSNADSSLGRLVRAAVLQA